MKVNWLIQSMHDFAKNPKNLLNPVASLLAKYFFYFHYRNSIIVSNIPGINLRVVKNFIPILL